METIALKSNTVESGKAIEDKRKQDITDKITEPVVMHIIVMKRKAFKRLIETLERSYSIPKHSIISEALICMHSNPLEPVLTQKRSSTAGSLKADGVHFNTKEERN